MHKFKLFAAVTMMSVTAIAAHAESWTLDSSMSSISFGSIKNDYIGESHSFSDITGTVNDAGEVALDIALASVATNIDIRNERMVEFVFQSAPKAMVTAEIDKETLDGLATGEAAMTDAYGTVSLLGEELGLDAKFFVMRLSDDKVLVTTDGMVMLSTEDMGIDAGIDKLQELASLDSITRVSPVTMRLVFDRD